MTDANALTLYRCPVSRPTGILSDSLDPATIIAGAMGRARQGIDTERDRQVNAAVNTAVTQLQQRAPALAAPIIAQIQQAALTTSQQVMDAALRRAATALLQAEPWLSERVVAASRGAAGAATESGIATVARQAAPWLIAALVVGAAAYGIATARDR
jgi:hypothetical protein